MAENKSTAGTQQQEQRGSQSQSIERSGRRREGLERREAFPSLLAGNPFSFMRRLTEEMDRLFDDFGMGRSLMPSFAGFPATSRGAWAPQVEVFQRENQFVVRAELPGLSKDDVQVEIAEDAINIQGERKEEREDRREGYYHSERSYGSFFRSIPLPEGAIADSAQATFRNGVLEVVLQAPPSEVSRGRRLEIQGESEKESEKRK